VLYALSLTLLRVRAQKEDAETIMWLGNGVPALLLMPAWLVFSGPFQVPQEWPWLALIGLLGYVTWYLFTRAYARAPAQLLAPLEYTALIWAALFGWFVFREPVPLTLYAGAAVIIAACLGVVLEGRRKTDVPEA
jgi:S-adenosylmethionine uptake transporter